MDKIISATLQDCRFQKAYNVVFEQADGTQYQAYFMSEAQYNYEVFKRKLLEQHNLPLEVVQELENVVDELKLQAILEHERDSDPDN